MNEVALIKLIKSQFCEGKTVLIEENCCCNNLCRKKMIELKQENTKKRKKEGGDGKTSLLGNKQSEKKWK
jgi:hypothetical protein